MSPKIEDTPWSCHGEDSSTREYMPKKLNKKLRITDTDSPVAQIKDTTREHEYFEPNPEGEEALGKTERPKVLWGYLLAILFLVILGGRLFLLQVREGFVNLKLAEGNRLKNLPIAAPRGAIVDINGKPLVENIPAYQLVFQRSKTKNIVGYDQEVFDIIGIKREDLINTVKSNKDVTDLIVLKDKLPRDEAILLKSRLAKYDDFDVAPSYSRQYIEQSLSHVLGYTGKVSKDDLEKKSQVITNGTSGKTGVEKTYDDYLQGIPGYRRAEVDSSGRVVRLLSQVEPQPGSTLQTTIDLDLQKVVTEALRKKTDELGTKGVVIALDPRDGSIRALVSLPYYDNTQLSSGISQDDYQNLIKDPNLPMFDRAIAGSYPSGSSIKPFIATTALQDGVINDSLAFDTPPEIVIGQWHYPDWKDHGMTDIRRAIAESNNVFFFSIGGGWGPIKTGLGVDRIDQGLEKFGFGKPTGIDLIGEVRGFLPTQEWKKETTGENWFIGDTYNLSVGQGGLLVTPIQEAIATAAIANGGTLYKPHSVSRITESAGDLIREFKDNDNLIKKDIFSGNNINVVREGMRMTITEGSARSVFGDYPLSVAGKTGTAQFGNEGKTHAWFTSFAPYDDPKIEITVLVEGGGEGNVVAAPIAKEIYDWWLANRE